VLEDGNEGRMAFQRGNVGSRVTAVAALHEDSWGKGLWELSSVMAPGHWSLT
jgi:hypothetical protein